jgi:hypothetical protein
VPCGAAGWGERSDTHRLAQIIRVSSQIEATLTWKPTFGLSFGEGSEIFQGEHHPCGDPPHVPFGYVLPEDGDLRASWNISQASRDGHRACERRIRRLEFGLPHDPLVRDQCQEPPRTTSGWSEVLPRGVCPGS